MCAGGKNEGKTMEEVESLANKYYGIPDRRERVQTPPLGPESSISEHENEETHQENHETSEPHVETDDKVKNEQIESENDVSVNDENIDDENKMTESEKDINACEINREDVRSENNIEVEENEPEIQYNVTKVKDFNSEIILGIKKRAKARTSSRWRNDHPVYGIIKNGFKVDNQNTQKTKRKHILPSHHSFTTDDLPQSSEYVKEAKRIYPQGFGLPVLRKNEYRKDSQNARRANPTRAKSEKILYSGAQSDPEEELLVNKRAISKIPLPKRIQRKLAVDSKDHQDERHNIKPDKSDTYRKYHSTKSTNNNEENDRLKEDKEYIARLQDEMNNELSAINTSKMPNTSDNNKKTKPLDTNKTTRSKLYFQHGDILDENTTVTQTDIKPQRDRGTVNNAHENNGYPKNLSNGTSTGTRSTGSLQSENDSISAAVEIMQSRNKFYSEYNRKVCR